MTLHRILVRPCCASLLGFSLVASAQAAPQATTDKPMYNDLPAQGAEATGLIVITHGVNSDPAEWAVDLKDKITARLGADAAKWDIVAYDWKSIIAGGKEHGAKMDWYVNLLNEEKMLKENIKRLEGPRNNAMAIGDFLGGKIKDRNYTKVHFLGHSAGCWLNDRAADRMKADPPHAATIQQTFLDAFMPTDAKDDLGDTAMFAIQYVDTRELKVGGKEQVLTNADLKNAYNLDVTKLDASPPINNNLENFQTGHVWPHKWYRGTAKKTPELDHGWGYLRSLEKGTMPSFGDTIDGREVKKGTRHALPPPEQPKPAKQAPVEPGPKENFEDVPQGQQQNASIDPEDGTIVTLSVSAAGTPQPAWIEKSVFASGSTAPNILQFQYDFTGSGQGWFAVYLDNELVFDIDERYARTYLTGPDDDAVYIGDLTPGSHTLGFRLDPFSDDQNFSLVSSLTLSGVRLSYALIPDASVPAVSEWGLLVMTLLVLTAATVVIMRRRAMVHGGS